MDTLNAIAIQMFEMPFDQLTSEAKKDVLEAARPNERAGGGMMDINRMTAPLGYKEGTRDGTLVGDAEKKSFSQRIYNMLAPNEKMSDEQLRLQGINPSSVLPEERPMAKNNPEGILQGLAREILGIGKKAEGSTLSDDAIDMRILGMKLELQQVLPLSIIDEMETMSVDEVINLYNKTFGN